MLYRNDNIKITDDSVVGKIKDLKTYFRYEIASLCMTGDECDFETFRENVIKILDLLNDFENEEDINIIVEVKEQPVVETKPVQEAPKAEAPAEENPAEESKDTAKEEPTA